MPVVCAGAAHARPQQLRRPLHGRAPDHAGAVTRAVHAVQGAQGSLNHYQGM